MPLDQIEIGIGAPDLGRELGSELVRLGPGKAALPGAEPHQNQLVVLATFQLKGPAIGPAGDDRLTKVYQREWPVKPCGVGRGKVAHDLPEESLQVSQPVP